MHFRHKISIVCILVIVFQIAQCAPSKKTGQDSNSKTSQTVQSKKVTVIKNSNNIFSGFRSPIPGYHYTTMAEVSEKFKPGSYQLLPMKKAKKLIEKEKKKLKMGKSSKDEDDKSENSKEHDDKDDSDDKDDKHVDTEDHDDDDDKVEIIEIHDFLHGDKVEVTKDHHDGKEDDKEENKNINLENGDDVKEKKEEEKGDHDNNEEESKDKKEGHGKQDAGIMLEELVEAEDKLGVAGEKEELVEAKNKLGVAGEKKELEEAEEKLGVAGEKKELEEAEEKLGVAGEKKELEEAEEKLGVAGEKKELEEAEEKLGVAGEKEEPKKKGQEDEIFDDGADFLAGDVIAIMENSAKENKRKKRDFFPFKLPFMSSSNDATKTDTTITTETVSTTTTTAAKGSKEATTVTDTKVTATAKVGSGSDETIAKVTTVQTTKDTSTGIIEGLEMHIQGIGKDVKTSLVVAAPYLPIVWKVSQFLIPGLSQYQMLVMTVNVAMATADALKKYDSGQSVQSIIFDAVKKEIWSSILRKRDGGNAISNLYESLKTHIGNIPKYFSGDKTTKEVTIKIDETTKGVEKVETEVTAINGEITGAEVTVTKNEEKSLESIDKSNKMTEVIEKKIMKMKTGADSSESSMSGSNSDFSADSVEVDMKSIAKSVDVDQGLFNHILNLSMNLQPEFIRNMSGEELVAYLNSLNIQSYVDSKSIFERLTNEMKFGDNVTDEQKKQLVEMLSKITDYFVAKGLEAKKLVTVSID